VEAALVQAIHGEGAPHVLINATMGTFKTSTALRLSGAEAAKRRAERKRAIERYRADHPGTPGAEAARVIGADPAPELRPFRVRYFAETHELVAATVRDARERFGLSAEHHGGYGRAYDPADLTAPAVCTQPKRREPTQLAGESVPENACNSCPDFGGCARWQRLADCGRVEFVGIPIDYAFQPFLPRQLTDDFDLTIVDEAPDRAGYGQSRVSLDYLSDRHFGAHPVRDAEGEPDFAATEAARAEYKLIRNAFDAALDGYAPTAAVRASGFDADRLLRLVAMTEARDADTGMRPSTPDDERAEIARRSFRRQIGALCGLFRQLAEPGDGWVRLEQDDDRRYAIVRSLRKLHPSILAGRVVCLDGSPDIESWRRFVPDLEVIDAPIPSAPHQTAVQIVRPNGKHAMRNPARKAYNKALVSLYGYGETGVLTHLEHKEDFAAPNVITGHYGGLAGRNRWKNNDTLFAFGLPFLSPEAAAYEGAARTGEAIAPAMPVRTLRPVMMKGGGITLVPSMDYQHPAAIEAQASVRERQAMQGPGGRPRATSRTADNPNTLIYVGTSPLPGVEHECVITGPEQFAPDRFVRMAATVLVVASGLDRHRVHSEIYPKPHTADYDIKREAGGTIETLQRVLYPSWWKDRPREDWIELRYWVDGRGNRKPGRIAACKVGAVSEAKERLRVACGAVRIELVAVVRRPAQEVTRMPVYKDITWILGTFPKPVTGPLFAEKENFPPDDWMGNPAGSGAHLLR
jgi:hypothetical protein